jgi:putative endonuclease
MYYTYVLKSEVNGQFYTGATFDIEKRIMEHAEGRVRSTKHKGPFCLVYFEACLNKDDAFRREKYLKTDMGKRYIRNRIKKGLTG